MFCGAETGSGKTLAYLAPLVSQLKDKEHQGVVGRLRCPRSLILAPSRELAFQILVSVCDLCAVPGLQVWRLVVLFPQSVVKHIAHFSKIRAVGFIGGVKRVRPHPPQGLVTQCSYWYSFPCRREFVRV